MSAPADTLVERLEAFPLFCSTDGGVHWLKGAIAKEPLCLEAAARIRTLEQALRTIKPLVVGEKRPNWDGEGNIYVTRKKIADICDIAIKEPSK